MGTSAGRALLGAAAVSACTVGLAAATIVLCRGPLLAVRGHLDADEAWSVLPLETLLAALAATALGTSVGWLALVMLAAALEALTGLRSTAVRAMTPAVVRRLAALCCGLALGGGGPLAATASEEFAAHNPMEAAWPARGGVAGADALEGLPLPDRVTGATLVREGGPAAAATAPARYVVQAGDSLWSVAASLLPRTAATSDVDAAWRTVYRANRSRVGPDPDLLLPGATLRLPRQLSHPPAGDDAPAADPQRKDAS